jgi:hypothetical protein
MSNGDPKPWSLTSERPTAGTKKGGVYMKNHFSRIVLPPKKYVIQGIMKPEFKPKRTKPLEQTNPKTKQETKHQICATCDFHDKECGRCLIKQLGSNCPYTNGGNGYVSFNQI